MANRPKPLVLLILDGFGLRVERDNNTIALANTPYWERMQQEYPITALDSSQDVPDLPTDQMGNSEQRAFFRNSGLCRNIGKAIDGCLESIVTVLKQLGGRLLLIVGHGNIEQLLVAESGRAHTVHATNLVPLMPVGDSRPLQDGGNLADLALTIRVILGVQQSVEMTGRSLIG